MSVWLTRIVLDTRHRAVRADLRDAIKLHKRVMMLVPDDLGDQARARTGVLFRLEENHTGVSLLVQSRHRPDLDRLPDGYGTAAVKDLDPLLEALRPACRSTTGSPRTRRSGWPRQTSTTRPSRSSPSREPPRTSGGPARRPKTALRSHPCSPRPLCLPPAGTPTRSRRIRHSLTRFDGLAIITDPDRIRAAILEGIGRGKSYGCGLLSLAPVRP